MCTSLTIKTQDTYFGRNMDIETEFGEIVTTPRNYPITWKHQPTMPSHYAMIGTALVSDQYPLYADAINEAGLAMAGLNFPDYAHYLKKITKKKYNIAPYELILWVLSQCATVEEARRLIGQTALVATPFSDQLPLPTLHWHIADHNSSIVVEYTKESLKIWDNPIGVLANNPTFDFHLTHLALYQHLSIEDTKKSFQNVSSVKSFCKGMGSLGLPGDFSSTSRLVKLAFLRVHSECLNDDASSVTQFFHLLDSVAVPTGLISKDYRTIYSCCYNCTKKIYYYKTYRNSKITAVSLENEVLNQQVLICYPFIWEPSF